MCDVPAGHGTAIGTRVSVKAGGRTMVQDIASSGSYLSAHDPRLHFGLGNSTSAERVEVTWPDGTRRFLQDVAANQFVRASKPP